MGVIPPTQALCKMGDIQQVTEKYEAEEQVSLKKHAHDNIATVTVKKIRYPYGSVFFLLSSTVGQSYSGTGLQAVLELYFSRFLFVCLTGADQLSTTAFNIYVALYQLCALSAGFLADRILGNFWTQISSTLVTTIGIFILAFSTWQYTIIPPSCCVTSGNSHDDDSLLGGSIQLEDASLNWSTNCSELHKVVILSQINLNISPTVNMVLSIIGLILFSIGYGQINAIQSVLIADQFTENQSKSKERSFSWFYWCCNVGSLVGESGMPILRQSVGFVVAWLTILGATSSSAILFLSGGCLYVKKKPKCLKCSCHSKKSKSLNESKSLLTKKQRTTTGSHILARALELLPFLGVFAPLIVFWAIFYQQNSTWILQGTMMNCYLGSLHVPPDLMPSVNDFLVLLIIPALDYIVYPHLEKSMGFKIRPLHKVVVGMIAAALSFLLSGLLQLYLVKLPQGREDCLGDVNIAWQLPQIVLISFAEVLVSVTGLEFAYSQAPPDFRNVITSFWYISQALGTLLNAGLAQIPGLTLRDEFFMYTGLMTLVTALFVAINWKYKYRDSN